MASACCNAASGVGTEERSQIAAISRTPVSTAIRFNAIVDSAAHSIQKATLRLLARYPNGNPNHTR